MLYKVDAIIPAYNAELCLQDSVDSVIAQGRVINKIIIVNDGSTDNTRQIAERLKKKYHKITLINQKNCGLANARNVGIRRATSKYIALLDADDVWINGKIHKQLTLLKNNPNTGVVYCDYMIINNTGNSGKDAHVANDDIRGMVYTKLLEGNYILGSGSSVVISRSALKDIGLFDENLPTCEDWDLWIRLAKKYEFDYVPEVLVKIRKTSNSLSNNYKQMAIGMCKLYDKHQVMLSNEVALNYLYSIIIPSFIFGMYRNKLLKEIKHSISIYTYHRIFSFNTLISKHIIQNVLHCLILTIKRLPYDHY